MNKKVWIKSNKKNIEEYFLINKTNIFSSKIINNYLLYKISENDYKKIQNKEYLKIELYSKSRTSEILSKIYNNKKYIFPLLLFFINISILSKIIVKVDVKSNNTQMNELLEYELKINGIKRLTLAKKYDQLDKIKQGIILSNKDKLEWLEIKKVGMKYEIYYEERKLNKTKEEPKYCDIISKKDAVVSSVIIYKGTPLVTINDSVKAGDALVSGEITFKDQIINKVCANAAIYANTWYTIKTTIPTYMYKVKKENKYRYNIVLKKNKKEQKLFETKYTEYSKNDYLIFKIFNIKFYIRKEQKITYEKINLSEEELVNIAINKGLKTLKVTLDNKSQIIEQKVLKKNIKNSKMYIEVFVSVKENISKQQILE